jgi:hypothetical protein
MILAAPQIVETHKQEPKTLWTYGDDVVGDLAAVFSAMLRIGRTTMQITQRPNKLLGWQTGCSLCGWWPPGLDLSRHEMREVATGWAFVGVESQSTVLSNAIPQTTL